MAKKKGKPQYFHCPDEANFVSDECLAETLGWPGWTPAALWKAVKDDSVMDYYNYCKDHQLQPEVLHIGSTHVFVLAFVYGSWTICIWIIFRIFKLYDEEKQKEIAAIVSAINEAELQNFVQVHIGSFGTFFAKLALLSGPNWENKWQKMFPSGFN